MRIIHVIQPNLVFAKGPVEFVDKYYDKNEHEILYLNNGVTETLINQKVSLSQHELFIHGRFDVLTLVKVIRLVREYDFVVFHSLFMSFFLKLFVAFDRKLNGKIVWIGFGGDIYLSNKKSLHSGLNRLIGGKCKVFVGIFPPDCKVFESIFPKAKCRVFYAPYCFASIDEFFLNGHRLKEHDGLRILVGHSASKDINHDKTLYALSHLKDEDIRLVVPLSYGDIDYAKQIVSLGETLFGDKFMPILDFMPMDRYDELINSIDIAVFDTTRQIALGNIHKLLFNRSKVYLPRDSVMYNYFRENGINIHDTNELAHVSVDALSNNDDFVLDRVKYNCFLGTLTDMNAYKLKWDKIYDYLEDKCGE